MTKRSSRTPRFAPLQELTLQPITDPAELAALEERIRAAEEQGAIRDGQEVEARKATPSRVRELYQQLPASARLRLLARLAVELPAKERRQLAEQLRSRLPRERPA